MKAISLESTLGCGLESCGFTQAPLSPDLVIVSSPLHELPLSLSPESCLCRASSAPWLDVLTPRAAAGARGA